MSKTRSRNYVVYGVNIPNPDLKDENATEFNRIIGVFDDFYPVGDSTETYSNAREGFTSFKLDDSIVVGRVLATSQLNGKFKENPIALNLDFYTRNDISAAIGKVIGARNIDASNIDEGYFIVSHKFEADEHEDESAKTATESADTNTATENNSNPALTRTPEPNPNVDPSKAGVLPIGGEVDVEKVMKAKVKKAQDESKVEADQAAAEKENAAKSATKVEVTTKRR